MKIAPPYCIYNVRSCRFESRFRSINMAKLDDHPTVIRHRQLPPQVPPKVVDADRLRGVCLDAGADDVGFVAIDRPELDDQRDEILAPLPVDEGADQHRLPDEPGADPQPGPLGRQPGVPSHRATTPTRSPTRIVAALEAEGVRAVNPSMGFPMEMDRVPRQDLGRLAQAGRRGGGARPDGHPPQRHPPEVRQLHPPGHGPDRRRGLRAVAAHRLQPVPGVQALRGGLPGRGDRPRRPLRLLGLLHAQLPGVPRRVRRLGRAGRRQQGRPRLPPPGERLARRPRCGRASGSGRTTRRRTAWRSARRART